ncbi:MAG: AAA family ATPase [Bacteroidota bacterium]
MHHQIIEDLVGRADFTLSKDQEEALGIFIHFMRSDELRATYLLTGSAGTGKTFLIQLFTRYVKKLGYKVVLLAPTGRAAKVITRRTQRAAFTIHHHIYSPREGRAGDVAFTLKENKAPQKTIYIVDEASMIGDKRDSTSHNSLLTDLLAFVFEKDELRKLVLVGDPVQLPPVGHDESPALDKHEVGSRLWLSIFDAHLTDVKRQETDSGILAHAVQLRDVYQRGEESLILNPNRDVMTLETPYESIETYIGYYEQGNSDRVVFLTYSNYLATRVNHALRQQIFYAEETLVPGDLLMVVRNNYAWGDNKRLPFIANGEMGTVREVYQESYEELYGLKWMDVDLEFQDSHGEYMLINCKIVLDLLTAKQPQLTKDTQYTILMERQREYASMSPSKAAELMRTDPYVNALQVKYGYAVTGHKSQGGQWENVIIGFEPDYGQNPRAYLRWTYTAMTRAEERLFLLNCPFIED